MVSFAEYLGQVHCLSSAGSMDEADKKVHVQRQTLCYGSMAEADKKVHVQEHCAT